MGVLSADNFVNPTISEKYIVTESNVSAITGCPAIREIAIDLRSQICYRFIQIA